MDQHPGNVVKMSVARIKKGENERRNRRDKIKTCGFIFVLFALIATSVYIKKSDTTKPYLNAQHPETEYFENGDVQVTISQGKTGHYEFVGEINGKKVNFCWTRVQLMYPCHLV